MPEAVGTLSTTDEPGWGDESDRSWFAVWNLRGDGSCHCGWNHIEPTGKSDGRLGKHPFWERSTGLGYWHGHRDAEVRERVERLIEQVGGRRARLARACGVGGADGRGEMVLDADGLKGTADLLRVWERLPWGLEGGGGVVGMSTSPRGVHVHLRGRGWSSQRGQRRLRENGLRNLELKGRGSYVVWPGEPGGEVVADRAWLSYDEIVAWKMRMERVWAGQMAWVRAWDVRREARGDLKGAWPWDADFEGVLDPAEDGDVEIEQDVVDTPNRRGVRYGSPVEQFGRAAAWLERQREGDRNNALNWVGFVSGRAAIAHDTGKRVVTEGEVEAAMTKAALKIGLGHGETARTIRSSLRGGVDGQ